MLSRKEPGCRLSAVLVAGLVTGLIACAGACNSDGATTDAGTNSTDAATDGGLAGSDASSTADGATSPGSDSFPQSAPWYQSVSAAGTATDSAAIISHLQSAGWGTLGIDISFSVLHADASVARRAYTPNASFYYEPDCDFAPVPLPPGGSIENYPQNGYACGGGDCHLIVFQGTRLYELYVTNVAGGKFDGNPFTGGCLAIWDLTHDYWTAASPYARGADCGSADAAGLPIAPLLLTAAELSSGEIKHALRFTLSNTLIRDASYVHPATHGTSAPGGASGGANTMPYGSRLRLKAGAYPSIGAAGQVVVKALQKYGMFMADGGNLYISGTYDLSGLIGAGALGSLSPSDFEVVDSGAAIPWNGNCSRTPLTN